jgi:hypothetical protein
MDQKTHDKGLEIRKAVLGEAYVNNALKNADGFNKPFQELVTEYCWGAVWGRDELPRKTRSMLNLAAKRSNPPRRIKNEWIASAFALRATADKSSLRSSQ